MKAIEENKLSTTDRINIVIKRHFNKYFKQHYITKNMNEWSALRRSLKKLISLEVRLKQSQIEQLQKENEKERKGRERLRNIYAEKLTENLGLKERIEEAFKLVENIDGRHLSFDDVRSDLLELLNKQN